MSNRFSSPVEIPGQYCVGYVSRAHGIRGELFLGVFAGQADWLDQVNRFGLVRPRQSDIEFREVDLAVPHKNGIIFRMAGVTSRTEAESYRGTFVYIDEKFLVAPPGDGFFLRQIEGFRLIDVTIGEVGEIFGFSTNTSQDLLRVRVAEGEEALVPLVDQFLVDIDFDKREVRVDLPPGLLDLGRKS